MTTDSTTQTTPVGAAAEAFARARLRTVVLEGVRQHGPITFAQIRRRIVPNVGHGHVDRALKTLREQELIYPTKYGWCAYSANPAPSATTDTPPQSPTT